MQHMEIEQKIKNICLNENGSTKPKDECRATVINFLILEEGMGVDEAEDMTDKTLRESGLWPIPEFMNYGDDEKEIKV